MPIVFAPGLSKCSRVPFPYPDLVCLAGSTREQIHQEPQSRISACHVQPLIVVVLQEIPRGQLFTPLSGCSRRFVDTSGLVALYFTLTKLLFSGSFHSQCRKV